MITNERGFSLIEALISLVIVTTMSMISYPFIVNLYDYIRLNQALTTFQADLHYVRDFNMMQLTGDQPMILRIYHNENRYVLLIQNDVLLERYLPNSITMPHKNNVSNISFNSRGNLGAGRTIRIVSRRVERRIVFSVGVGGFDVRKM